MSDWEAALDALEEWVRRTLEDLSGPEPHRPDAAPLVPAGPAPEPLRLRCQALAGALREAEAAVLRRREELRRLEAYGAA